MTDLESLFHEVSEKFLQENDCFSTRGELGVYSHAAVVWLGIQQRLSDNSLKSSLSTLIDRIREDTCPVNLALRPGKKFREGKMSLNTGGLSRARERMPVELVSQLFNAATANIEKRLSCRNNLYLMDGQVLAISRTPSNLQTFGKTGNGEGELHFPRMRVVAAHHLSTGICKSLAIGGWLDTELTLGKEVFSELPRGSIVVMDRYFDKPTFLNDAQEKGIHVVVRIREVAARRLFGKELPKDEHGEKRVTWRPADKKQSDIAIDGRVMKFTAAPSGFRSSEFYFFTTAPSLTLDEVAALYRQRVQVETFIRQIKQTLKLFFVRAKKAANVEKEIYIAYLTFNLLRAIMQLAAEKAKLEPERVSFTAAMMLCRSYAPQFLRAKTKTEREELFERFVENIMQTKIPKRKKERSYPRVVKSQLDKYPRRAVVKNYDSGEN
jgi:hypothetical protein